MKSDKLTRILSYVCVALLSATVTLAITLGIFNRNQYGSDKLDALEELIAERFIGEEDKTAMEDAAAAAMIEALGDRWSYYIPADQYASHVQQMENAYVGIGITVTTTDDGAIQIYDVAAGGPAEEVGMQVGDIIVGVAGQRVTGMTTSQCKQLIQGPENTTVQIVVQRGSEEVTLEVARRMIVTRVAEGTMLEAGIGLVTIRNFNANCATQTIAAIEQLCRQGAEKLIFDVRNNPGGYASELVKVLDYLLPEGKLFTTVDYSGQENTDYSDAKCLNMPMAVLINGNSYSAAEFFAAAMQEYDAAVLVGQKTVGKGYFQSTFQLPDGSAVNLSIGKYYTPKGVNLADVGITPDIPVQPAENQTNPAPMEDPQVLAAVEALRG